jgi:hypothetical protein
MNILQPLCCVKNNELGMVLLPSVSSVYKDPPTGRGWGRELWTFRSSYLEFFLSNCPQIEDY